MICEIILNSKINPTKPRPLKLFKNNKNAFNYSSGDRISINHLLIQLKIWAEANLPVWSYCWQRSPIARAEAWGIGRKKVCSSVDTEKKKNNHKTKTEKRVKVQLGRIYVVQFANRKLNNLHSILGISAMSITMQPRSMVQQRLVKEYNKRELEASNRH